MSNRESISTHYENGGNLLEGIMNGLAKLGKSPETVTIEDLGPVDEFHIGGRAATDHLIGQLNFSPEHHLLDVGCGLGGAARYVASNTGGRVTGIDVTEEYINTGQALCQWVGLDNRVTLHHAGAQSLPFEDNHFDGAYMIHVGMNLPDKEAVFAEIGRVLKPGAVFGIYDIMRVGQGELTYPVPWASGVGLSHLATSDQYKSDLNAVGFEVSTVNSRQDFALQFFTQMRARSAQGDGPPPLGLHLLMKESTPAKIKNMVGNLEVGLIAPVEIISKRL